MPGATLPTSCNRRCHLRRRGLFGAKEFLKIWAKDFTKIGAKEFPSDDVDDDDDDHDDADDHDHDKIKNCILGPTESIQLAHPCNLHTHEACRSMHPSTPCGLAFMRLFFLSNLIRPGAPKDLDSKTRVQGKF